MRRDLTPIILFLFNDFARVLESGVGESSGKSTNFDLPGFISATGRLFT
jgi:hypothetical protein